MEVLELKQWIVDALEEGKRRGLSAKDCYLVVVELVHKLYEELKASELKTHEQ